MDYYLDESGSTGDIINKKLDLDFASQPIFSHACIGLKPNERNDFIKLITSLKEKYGYEDELKSQDVYYKTPEFIYEISSYMKNKKINFLCEVVDKKYNIAVSIVNHQIFPPTENSFNEESQYIRTKLTDYLALYGDQEVFENFMLLCLKPSEDKLLKSFETLKSFFSRKSSYFPDDGLTVSMIDETIDDYNIAKKKLGSAQAISYFIPIPDFDNNSRIINITPHVQCFYNIIARVNKLHSRKLSSITLHHDIQKEFSSSISYCFEKLKEVSVDNVPHIPNADFNLTEMPVLLFEDSEEVIGIQASDLLSGFMNRFTNGFLYKKIDVSEVYLKTFDNLTYFNKYQPHPLGVNFVLPESIRNELFRKFRF